VFHPAYSPESTRLNLWFIHRFLSHYYGNIPEGKPVS
jgi:hypothetical protein